MEIVGVAEVLAQGAGRRSHAELHAVVVGHRVEMPVPVVGRGGGEQLHRAVDVLAAGNMGVRRVCGRNLVAARNRSDKT